MTTIETLRKIKAAGSNKAAMEIARKNAVGIYEGRDIEACQLDNGWSLSALYEMPDGGVIEEDGRGWHAVVDGELIF